MVQVFDFKDKSIKFRKSLVQLGFDFESTNIGATIQTEILDTETILLNKRFKKAQRAVESWENKLKRLLSKPVGKYFKKKRPALSKYPKMNSGALRDSVRVNLSKTHTQKEWVYEFTASVVGKNSDDPEWYKNAGGWGIDDHANATNEAWNSSKRNVRWKDWVTDTFGNGHSASLVGARVLMRNIFDRDDI